MYRFSWFIYLRKRFQFECPEMENLFEKQQETFISKTFTPWCVYIFLNFASGLVGRAYSFPHQQDATISLFAPYGCILIVLALLLFIHYFVPRGKKFVVRLLPLTCVLLFAGITWNAHCDVALQLRLARELSLKDVFTALSDKPELAQELDAFLCNNILRKVWWLSLAQEMLILDGLQIAGMAKQLLWVHFVPIIAYSAMYKLSSVVADHVGDLMFAVHALALYALANGIYILLLQRKQFQLDFSLQRMLKKEAEILQQLRDTEIRQQESSCKADTMLNHILTNLIADALGCIDIAVAEGYNDPGNHLHRVTECLRRGMCWCSRRQALLQMVTGIYTTMTRPTDLRKFVAHMVMGREVKTMVPSTVASIDPILCEIVLENALSNALSHGCTSHPDVKLMVEASPSSPQNNTQTVTIRVSNAANSELPPMDSDILEKARVSNDVLSGRLANGVWEMTGLNHLLMAADAHQMQVSLSQQSNLVTFEATISTQSTETSATELDDSMKEPLSFKVLEGTCIICLDDSAIARRLVVHAFHQVTPLVHVSAYGADVNEVNQFMAEVLSTGDIAILDQHLAYAHKTLLGTDLMRELRHRGFTGLLCIRSANVSSNDLKLYYSSGAQVVLGKDLRGEEMVTRVAEAYGRHLEANAQTIVLSPRPDDSLHGLFSQNCNASSSVDFFDPSLSHALQGQHASLPQCLQLALPGMVYSSPPLLSS